MTDFTPLPVPIVDAKERIETALSDEQEAKRKEVLAHFAKDDFRIPGEEKGELEDVEKFWLVSILPPFCIKCFKINFHPSVE